MENVGKVVAGRTQGQEIQRENQYGGLVEKSGRSEQGQSNKVNHTTRKHSDKYRIRTSHRMTGPISSQSHCIWRGLGSKRRRKDISKCNVVNLA